MVDAMAATGKGAARVAFGRERADGNEGSATRRRRSASFPSQLVLTVGNRGHLVCALPGEGGVAIEPCGAVSAADYALSCPASGRGSGSLAVDYRRRSPRAPAPVSCCRVVLVLREPGADDRAGTNWSSVHGRSLRPHSFYRPVSDVCLAGRRLGRRLDRRRLDKRSLTLHPVACRSRRFLSAGAGDSYLPSGWLLARYCVILAADAGADSEQLRRARHAGSLS